MTGLSAEQVAAMRADHHRAGLAHDSWCRRDREDWPCTTRRLLDALADAEQRATNAERERDTERARVQRVEVELNGWREFLRAAEQGELGDYWRDSDWTAALRSNLPKIDAALAGDTEGAQQ